MAHNSITHELIEIPVTDLVIAGTRVKQKARFKKLIHKQKKSGPCSAKVKVILETYAAVDGSNDYGQKLTGSRFVVAPLFHRANNNKIVDAATGAVLQERNGETDEQWLAVSNAFPQATMFQGDFFEVMRKYGVLDLPDLIEFHIRQADQMGLYL